MNNVLFSAFYLLPISSSFPHFIRFCRCVPSKPVGQWLMIIVTEYERYLLKIKKIKNTAYLSTNQTWTKN